MPLDIGAYLGDTMRLTTQQHGAYFLLLLDYWKSGPLPDDDAVLAGLTKVDPTEWKSKVGPVVRRFFNLGGDGLLHQKRSDAEIEKAGRISDARREAALARHEKPPDDDANEMQTDSKLHANNGGNGQQTNHENAGIARGRAVAPPSPSQSKQAAAALIQEERPRARPSGGNRRKPSMPTLGSDWAAWEWLTGGEVEICGPSAQRRPIAGGFYVDGVARDVAEAAGMNGDQPGIDWTPIVTWLREGIPGDVIVSAVKGVAKRDGYEAPHSLRYFEKPVHAAHAKGGD